MTRQEDVMERLRNLIAEGSGASSPTRAHPGREMRDAGERLARFIASPESVEDIALTLAAADAEQPRWGRSIMPLDVARELAQAVLNLLAQKALDDGS
jgi:hypothetical protein